MLLCDMLFFNMLLFYTLLFNMFFHKVTFYMLLFYMFLIVDVAVIHTGCSRCFSYHVADLLVAVLDVALKHRLKEIPGCFSCFWFRSIQINAR